MPKALRTLLVEDSENDAQLLVRELQRGGYTLTVERVDTAPALEAALQHRRWDVIFSDWSMPQFSAPAALEVVKRRQLDVPFIIISGEVGEDIAVAALQSGAHDFLVKDKLARLVPAVERELREAEIRRERKKMQELLMISDRMASVGILAAGVAHEINNPLASISVNLDLAVRDLTSMGEQAPHLTQLPQLLDELRDAREAADRIRDIVRDLKLFSRSDQEELAPVNVRRILESSLRMAFNEIRHRARLVTNFGPVPSVAANESRLGQVFLNLIVNAAQSIPEGHADANEITITTSICTDGRVLVECKDTGAGIPPEVMSKLFTPFVTTKAIGVGTGLGLSICHRIVTSLGGEIGVESEVGRGSTFKVFLMPASEEPAIEAPALQGKEAAVRRGSVLVIDDEPMVGKAINRALASDHEVTCTTSAQEALKTILDGARYDVILCDLMMPHMTGMDFHAELLKQVPELAERMIFLTGGAFTPRARSFLDEVTNLRIEKPFDIISLRSIVNDRIK